MQCRWWRNIDTASGVRKCHQQTLRLPAGECIFVSIHPGAYFLFPCLAPFNDSAAAPCVYPVHFAPDLVRFASCRPVLTASGRGSIVCSICTVCTVCNVCTVCIVCECVSSHPILSPLLLACHTTHTIPGLIAVAVRCRTSCIY